ncbi:hypothetical protein PGTUg99_033803 [Puccinia graminis f. sp. tritici]|uniref:Uncharacterized protein n=1 Tax=Puccinia graminis f. sp. tritici TaxID=56615 RepID=A0A5B0Q974_PUCGR|nr:hypothetical protein PGTUg99_033803 [Puccinia graminis f. sp. tritici]
MNAQHDNLSFHSGRKYQHEHPTFPSARTTYSPLRNGPDQSNRDYQFRSQASSSESRPNNLGNSLNNYYIHPNGSSNQGQSHSIIQTNPSRANNYPPRMDHYHPYKDHYHSTNPSRHHRDRFRKDHPDPVQKSPINLSNDIQHQIMAKSNNLLHQEVPPRTATRTNTQSTQSNSYLTERQKKNLKIQD